MACTKPAVLRPNQMDYVASSAAEKQSLREIASRTRPNSQVPDAFISPAVLLCCGEDRDELEQVMEKATAEKPVATHQYRCYLFYMYPRFTLIWTGIGTGCLEPLIFEITDKGLVEGIVLIGTAGYIGKDRSRLGKVYLLNKATPAASGVQLSNDIPLEPRFPGVGTLGLPTAPIVSTDNYYGFSARDDARVRAAHDANPHLRQAVERYWQDGMCIDMEVAPFYHLASHCDPMLKFAAIKGVANLGDGYFEQSTYSRAVLQESARMGLQLLDLMQTV